MRAQAVASDLVRLFVTGVAAHGAVLNTAAAAALLGLKVILPVDGMSFTDDYFDVLMKADRPMRRRAESRFFKRALRRGRASVDRMISLRE